MEKNALNLNQRNRSTKTTEAATTNLNRRRRSAKPAEPASPLPRKQAVRSVPGTTAAASGDRSAAFSPAERIEMIAIAAYHRAERRSFSGGSPEQDWLEAEAEIDRSLDRQRS
jgi:hypothetical protein